MRREHETHRLTFGCSTGKHAYATKTAAKRRARRAMANGDFVKVGPMHAYRCDECGAWHIGHPMGRWRERAS